MRNQISSSKKELTIIQHKITKVSSLTEVWECPLKGEKSLHATVTFKPDDIILDFGQKEVVRELYSRT